MFLFEYMLESPGDRCSFAAGLIPPSPHLTHNTHTTQHNTTQHNTTYVVQVREEADGPCGDVLVDLGTPAARDPLQHVGVAAVVGVAVRLHMGLGVGPGPVLQPVLAAPGLLARLPGCDHVLARGPLLLCAPCDAPVVGPQERAGRRRTMASTSLFFLEPVRLVPNPPCGCGIGLGCSHSSLAGPEHRRASSQGRRAINEQTRFRASHLGYTAILERFGPRTPRPGIPPLPSPPLSPPLSRIPGA